MMSDSDVVFADRQYGKNYVRLLHVRREGRRHYIREIEVNSRLKLNNVKDFVTGDNSDIIATDTQKNTVYILAKQHGVGTIEEFAMVITNHFLKTYPWVERARVEIEERPWKRFNRGGREHNHAFVEGGEGTHFCTVVQNRNDKPKVSAGIKDLKVMKTTQSAFVNFVNDEYRSLPDMDDRIFCTIVYTRWDYTTIEGLNFDRAWETVRDAVMEVFAGNPDTGIFSPSVQKTIYDFQKLALSKVPQMEEVYVELPNVHAYEYDLGKFPKLRLKNDGEVFQPTDKPSGNIQNTLRRRVPAKL